MKKIGIIGGMGPQSTVAFYDLIVKNTVVTKDQEHTPVVIYADPSIPDRTDAILNNGEDPTPHILKGIKFLEKCEVSFIVLICNTAHYFIPNLIKHTNVPIINMIEETANYIKKINNNALKIGIIATDGTIATNLYKENLENNNMTQIIPNKISQKKVMNAIYSIKKGETIKSKKALQKIYLELISKGAEYVIAGCTEVSLVLNNENKIIDPMDILAKKVIRLSYETNYEIQVENESKNFA